MTKPQKIKSLLYFICLIVSVLIYMAATTGDEENTIEKNTITSESNIHQGGLSNTTNTAY